MQTRFVAACLGALLALSTTTTFSYDARADGASLDDATDVQKQAAGIRYNQGMEAFKAGNFEAARKSFSDSFETVASPNSLLMVVRSLSELKRNVEAYETALKTAKLAEAAAKKDAKYLQTAKAAQGEAARLRGELGFVALMGIEGAPEGTAITVGGRPIDRSAWGSPIPVEPGDVPVTINGKPLPPVKVAPGAQATVDTSKVGGPSTEPVPPSGDDDDDDGDTDENFGTYRGPNRLMIATIAGGVAGTGLILTAIFGGLAQSNFNSLSDNCPNKQCPVAELEDDADQGKAFQAVANTGLVVGIIGAVAAAGFVTWHFIDPDAPTDDETAAKYAPKLRVGPGSVMLQGSF